MDEEKWSRSSVWMGNKDWFTFIDYDGESLKVSRRKATYNDDDDYQDYIALNYEGQGPVVMEVHEARRFIAQWTDLLDKMGGKE